MWDDDVLRRRRCYYYYSSVYSVVLQFYSSVAAAVVHHGQWPYAPKKSGQSECWNVGRSDSPLEKENAKLDTDNVRIISTLFDKLFASFYGYVLHCNYIFTAQCYTPRNIIIQTTKRYYKVCHLQILKNQIRGSCASWVTFSTFFYYI